MNSNAAAVISSVTAFSPSPASKDFNDRPQQDADRALDYRLVIEEGPRRGTFIYKTVDRTTGETIRQFPREEVVKMIADPRYAAGKVADTTA